MGSSAEKSHLSRNYWFQEAGQVSSMHIAHDALEVLYVNMAARHCDLPFTLRK